MKNKLNFLKYFILLTICSVNTLFAYSQEYARNIEDLPYDYSFFKKDTLSFPMIGIISSHSEVSIRYRIVDLERTIVMPKVLGENDEIEILISTDGKEFENLGIINKYSHIPSLAYVDVSFPVYSYASKSAWIKLVCRKSTGNFMFDVDQIGINDVAKLKETDANSFEDVTVSPIPATEYFIVSIESKNKYKKVEFINDCGKVFEYDYVSDYNGISFDVFGFPKNIYFARLTGDSNSMIKKVMIKIPYPEIIFK